MAHFAQLDSNNIVTQVMVVNNENLIDKSGQESEDRGISFCKSLFGEDTRWVQTSYNKNFRQNFAQIGFQYESNLDVFIPPQPFPSWKLDLETYTWKEPIPYPEDGNDYHWVEDTQTWEQIYYAPYPSWVMNEYTWQWEAPVPMPEDAPEGSHYEWNEDNVNWVLIENSI